MSSWNAERWLAKARVAQNISGPLKAVFENTQEIVRHREYQLDDETIVELRDKPDSWIYSSEVELPSPQSTFDTELILTDDDCIDYAHDMIEHNFTPAIMILGSIKQPGGGVLSGCAPQEEEIYRRTNIHVKMFKYGNFKGIRPSHRFQYPLDENYGVVYIGGTTVFRASRQEGYKLLQTPYKATFISVSSLDNKSGRPLTTYMQSVIKNKLRNVFNVALKKNCDSLVLGALGCDDYNNPPKEVAALFHEIIRKYDGRFKQIVFSIPKNQVCQELNVYEVFEKEFKDALLRYDEDDDTTQKLTEGTLINVHYGKYERSQKARKRCLQHYGYKCQLCGVNYVEKYGEEIGKCLIEVHHLDPIHGFQGKKHTIDPIKDLVPVCSNCHSILHSKSADTPYTLEEARALIGKKS